MSEWIKLCHFTGSFLWKDCRLLLVVENFYFPQISHVGTHTLKLKKLITEKLRREQLTRSSNNVIRQIVGKIYQKKLRWKINSYFIAQQGDSAIIITYTFQTIREEFPAIQQEKITIDKIEISLI